MRFGHAPPLAPMLALASNLLLASSTKGLVPLWAVVLAAVVVGAWIALRIVGAEVTTMRSQLIHQHRAELEARLQFLREQGRL